MKNPAAESRAMAADATSRVDGRRNSSLVDLPGMNAAGCRNIRLRGGRPRRAKFRRCPEDLAIHHLTFDKARRMAGTRHHIGISDKPGRILTQAGIALKGHIKRSWQTADFPTLNREEGIPRSASP